MEIEGRVDLGRLEVKVCTKIDRNGYTRNYSSEYFSRTLGREFADSWDRVRWGEFVSPKIEKEIWAAIEDELKVNGSKIETEIDEEDFRQYHKP